MIQKLTVLKQEGNLMIKSLKPLADNQVDMFGVGGSNEILNRVLLSITNDTVIFDQFKLSSATLLIEHLKSVAFTLDCFGE